MTYIVYCFLIPLDWHFKTGLIRENITEEVKQTNLLHKIIYTLENNFVAFVYLFSENKWKKRGKSRQTSLKNLWSDLLSISIAVLLAFSFSVFLWTAVLLNHLWIFAREQLSKVLCSLMILETLHSLFWNCSFLLNS